jgi:competence ComEA-like helix-hairpin-helix protein
MKIAFKLCRVVLITLLLSLVLSGFVFADSQDIKGKVDINQATVQELAKLPGIGKKKAEAIVTYRNEKGHFSSVEDLLKIEGIGKKTLEKIRDSLTVAGG